MKKKLKSPGLYGGFPVKFLNKGDATIYRLYASVIREFIYVDNKNMY